MCNAIPILSPFFLYHPYTPHSLIQRIFFLVGILSSYDCCEIPTHTNLLGLIAEIARHHFICKPAAIIMDMHTGVPTHHILFRSKVTGGPSNDSNKWQGIEFGF